MIVPAFNSYAVPNIVAQDLFSTNFPLTENPISQGGIWTNGLDTGIDWNNMKTSSKALGTVDMGVQRYADNIAHLKKSYITFANDQYARATLYVAPGYTGNGGYHEATLFTRMQITANNARGYETIYGMGPGSLAYIAVVRWEGAYGTFTTLFDSQLTPPAPPFPTDGDVIKTEIIGTTINVYRNGTLFTSVGSGGTWTEGQPGMGSWPADGGQHDNMGWKDYASGNI